MPAKVENSDVQTKIRNVIAKLSSSNINNVANVQILSEEEIKKKERKQKMNSIREATLIKVASRNAELQEQSKYVYLIYYASRCIILLMYS